MIRARPTAFTGDPPCLGHRPRSNARESASYLTFRTSRPATMARMTKLRRRICHAGDVRYGSREPARRDDAINSNVIAQTRETIEIHAPRIFWGRSCPREDGFGAVPGRARIDGTAHGATASGRNLEIRSSDHSRNGNRAYQCVVE